MKFVIIGVGLFVICISIIFVIRNNAKLERERLNSVPILPFEEFFESYKQTPEKWEIHPQMVRYIFGTEKRILHTGYAYISDGKHIPVQDGNEYEWKIQEDYYFTKTDMEKYERWRIEREENAKKTSIDEKLSKLRAAIKENSNNNKI